MSGRRFSNPNNWVNRRTFLLRAGLVMGGIMLQNCVRKAGGQYGRFKGTLRGPNAKAGHMLRDRSPIPEPTSTSEIDFLVIGGGISGLSAGRWLKKQGYDNFKLLELEDHAGGNAFFGSNQVSKYPLGAHYIPIINNEDTVLLDFLKEVGVVDHFDEHGLPFYDEYYLCFDPEERLLINGQWQEGIVPDFGVPQPDREQIIRFFALTEKMKKARGNDGKYAFNIPVDESSADEEYRKLDKISFTDYLQQNGFTSTYLLWYLNYCSKDDFGVLAKNISAWAGIHYFASRKGKAANTEPNSVITWPEGNGWLMSRLRDGIQEHILTSNMVYEVSTSADGVNVKVMNLESHTTSLIKAKKVIMASPQFVNQRLLKDIRREGVDYSAMNYSPWFIANITVNGLPTPEKGLVLCWDNVAYGTPSVGYVNANQQDTRIIETQKVLTWYLPLCDKEPRLSRLAAYSRTYDQWAEMVMAEMEQMHPGIGNHVESIDMWLWGHGMISPAPGYVWGETRRNAKSPIENKIFFAHTDLSGLSIFEEGFHHGIRAAEELIKSNHVAS